MQIDKSQIIDLLKSRGNTDQAAQAEGELPEKVATDKDAGLLSKFGLDPQDVIKQLAGDKLGGLGGKLGL